MDTGVKRKIIAGAIATIIFAVMIYLTIDVLNR